MTNAQRRELEAWDGSAENAVEIVRRLKSQLRPKVKIPTRKAPKPTKIKRDGRLVLNRLAWAKSRQEIYDRDGGICQICTLPIGNQAWEIDHIKPRGMGGGFRNDAPENLRLTHQRCNREKGSRRDV